MGAEQSKEVPDIPKAECEEVQKLIEEKGIEGAQNQIREKLESWKEKEITLCVTGMGGVGKSHFINAIRGLDYDTATKEQLEKCDYAINGPVEETNKPTAYSFPTNPKVQLVDVPGVGSPAYPDLNTYCENVPMDTYDAFLILVGQRVTNLELQLAKKIKSEMKKPFLLVRTKIDIDEMNENRKTNPDIEQLKAKIRAYYQDKMKDFSIPEEQVFLISNNHWYKWDFEKLIDTIKQKLPNDLREALILSLPIPAETFIRDKVKTLKGRLWLEAFLFLPPIPFDLLSFGAVSFAIESPRIRKKTKDYIADLGLPPTKESDAFKAMKPEFQERMKKFYPVVDNETFVQRMKKRTAGLCFPLTGWYYLKSVKECLNDKLNEMEELAIDIVKEQPLRAINLNQN